MSEDKILSAKEALRRGDFESVINLLKPLVNSMPDNNEIKSLLIEAQEGMMLRLQLTQKVKQAKEFLQNGDRDGAKKVVEAILSADPGNPDALELNRLLMIPPSENVNATVAFDFNSEIMELEEKKPPQNTELLGGTDGLEELEPFELSFDSQDSSTQESVIKTTEETPLETLDYGDSYLTGNEKVQAFPMDSLQGSEISSQGDNSVHPFPKDSFEESQVGEDEHTHLSSPTDMPFSLGGEENKVENFISEGRKLIAAKKFQDAIDVLTRVFILDEENKEAQILIDEAKTGLQELEQKVNLILNEAISAYDSQDYEKSKELLNKVLELFPGHREADFYLKEIEAKSQNVGFQLEQNAGVSTGFQLEQDSFTFEASEEITEDLSSLVTGQAKEEPKLVVSPPEPIVPTKPIPSSVKEKVAKPKKEGKQPPIKVVVGIVVALILVGGAFFVIPMVWNKFFKPKPTAMVIPPAPKKEQKKEIEIPPQNQQTQQSQAPKTLNEILLEANTAMQEKKYEKAVNLYTQAESMAKMDLEIKSKLESARIALAKQQEEEVRIQRFVSDYEKAVKYFKMSEYGEAVRISWRLIYPKEQENFAVQMGKADSIKKIIKNGYFNWAVKDLKAGNPSVAKKNLQDLLDFDPRDSKAREILSFAEKYSKSQIDEDYRTKVQDLSYRTIDD